MANQTVKQDQKELFGLIFLLAQRWQHMGDMELKESGITTKQWFFLVTLHALFETPPNLNELTQAMGSSRQNVKQLALILEKKGFVEINQDSEDMRVQRFKLTPKNKAFWDERADKDEAFIRSLFGKTSAEDLRITNETIKSLLTITDEQHSQGR